LASNLPLEFSSWNTDTAYVPGPMPKNSQDTFLSEIDEVFRRVAFRLSFGKPSAQA
jgi:hypothetical protein